MNNFAMLIWSWADAVRGQCTMTPQQQSYYKLQTVCGVLEQTLFTSLQLYVMLRQITLNSETPLVTPSKAGPAVASAILNLYFTYDFVKLYARLCTGGNLR